VCSPERFSVYFQLSVPAGGLTNAELNHLFGLTNDSHALGLELLRLVQETRPDGTSRAREALELLGTRVQDIPLVDAETLIRTLLHVGDQLQPRSDDRPAFFWIDNQLLIDQLFFGLLGRFDQEERLRIITDAVQAGEAVGTLVAFVSILGQEHGKYAGDDAQPEPDPLLTLDQQETLEALALTKVREAAANGALIDSPSLTRTLYRWRDWAGDAEPRDWVATLVPDNAQLARLFEGFLQVRVVAGVGNATAQQIPTLRPDWLEPFVDVDTLAVRAQDLLTDDSMTDAQRRAVEQFIKEYRGEVSDRD
jgi:predicted KAP-like P-loop ATPase